MGDFLAENQVGEALPAAGDGLCRICREQDEPLKHPCACRGSVKYVHEECLKTWLKISKRKKCEICGFVFSFMRVYSEEAPMKIPWQQLILLVLARASDLLAWMLIAIYNAYAFRWNIWGGLLARGLVYNLFVVYFFYLVAFLHMAGFRARVPRHIDVLIEWLADCLRRLEIFERPLEQDVPPHEHLNHFGVFRRSLYFLQDYTFGFLAISLFMSGFMLLPNVIGTYGCMLIFGSFLLCQSPPQNPFIALGNGVYFILIFGSFLLCQSSPQNPFIALGNGVYVVLLLGFGFVSPLMLLQNLWRNRGVLLLQDLWRNRGVLLQLVPISLFMSGLILLPNVIGTYECMNIFITFLLCQYSPENSFIALGNAVYFILMLGFGFLSPWMYLVEHWINRRRPGYIRQRRRAMMRLRDMIIYMMNPHQAEYDRLYLLGYTIRDFDQ